MAPSYCTKSCDHCAELEQGRCSGCRGGSYVSSCEIAKCCKQKGHESCGSCSFLTTCGTNRSSLRMPQLLLDRQRREEERTRENAARASILAAWVPMIFWCSIGRMAVSLLLSLLEESIPSLATVKMIVNAGMLAAVAYGYWRLKEADEGFRFVAIVKLLCVASNLLSGFLPENNVSAIIISICVAVLTVMSQLKLCLAFRDSLSGIHAEQSQDWEKQWTHMKYDLILLVVSIVLAWIPVIGVVGMLAGVFWLIFLTIRELVYLYRTMGICRSVVC